MANVLLGWELGAGLGHAGVLVPLARELAARGHRPVLALKDVVEAAPLLRDVPFPVAQAPVLHRPAPPNFLAADYADILAVRGFGDPDTLGALVRAWQTLLDETGAELVVADHSPALCLAAYGSVPVVLLGTGFTAPPAEGECFPPLLSDRRPLATAGQVLSVVRAVQGRRGRATPPALPGLFEAAGRFVRVVPELDPYRGRRREPVAGPLTALPAPAESLPSIDYFVYIGAEYPGVGEAFRVLGGLGLRGAAYLRGAPGGLKQAVRQAGAEVYDAPPALAEVIPRARVVVHYGGSSTAMAALALGRPQLLLPLHLEHSLTARTLRDLGVGHFIAGRPSAEKFAAAARDVFASPDLYARAMEQARALHKQGWDGCLPRIVERCCELLKSERSA